MLNFTMPAPEVDPDEEDPNEAEKIARQNMEKKSRTGQLTCCDPDPNLLPRARSEVTVMSSQEIPASQDPRR